MKILIVDDSRLARLELQQQLSSLKPNADIFEAENINVAEELLSKNHIDLMFLDIEMPGGNGFELLENCPNHPQVIFVTAYDQYAVDSFDVGATDYLLKPVKQQRLEKALDKLPENLGETKTLSIDSKIFIKDGKHCRFTSLDKVIAFESIGNYIKVHLTDGTPMIYKSLSELEKRLPEDTFFRANRGWIVNINEITDVQANEQSSLDISLADTISIEISRRQTTKFRQLWSL